jgi:hypothetical protein
MLFSVSFFFTGVQILPLDHPGNTLSNQTEKTKPKFNPTKASGGGGGGPPPRRDNTRQTAAEEEETGPRRRRRRRS